MKTVAGVGQNLYFEIITCKRLLEHATLYEIGSKLTHFRCANSDNIVLTTPFPLDCWIILYISRPILGAVTDERKGD